uniref:Uncharacterized protein n=1 Tax=Aegilops tauschii subsp. strangulata TaxID=200361 RepID=A0A453GU90_AEGTS
MTISYCILIILIFNVGIIKLFSLPTPVVEFSSVNRNMVA